MPVCSVIPILLCLGGKFLLTNTDLDRFAFIIVKNRRLVHPSPLLTRLFLNDVLLSVKMGW